MPDLQRLWREATDWGEQTLETLHAWFLAAPFGSPRIVVAVDEATEEVVGQFRFMPSRVLIDGREVRAVRPFGTIISPKLSSAVVSPNPLEQPAIAMYLRAVKELSAMGEQLIYMVPDPRWVRLFQMIPFLNCGSFPLWSLPVPLTQPFELPEGYAARPLENWDAQVDELWAKSSGLYGCAVRRDAQLLSWKLANAKYDVMVVERAGELIGLVASRAKGDRQWLICDALFADAEDSIKWTLAAAANVAHEQSKNTEKPLHKVALLLTPNMERAAASLGFKRDNYNFPLAVHILDSSIAAADVAPERWYVSAND